MSDNTTINSGSGGDSIRDIDRSGSGPKTQVQQMDIGGDSSNSEALVSKFYPMPVSDITVTDDLSLGEAVNQLLIETRVTNELLYAIAKGFNAPHHPDEYRDYFLKNFNRQ